MRDDELELEHVLEEGHRLTDALTAEAQVRTEFCAMCMDALSEHRVEEVGQLPEEAKWMIGQAATAMLSDAELAALQVRLEELSSRAVLLLQMIEPSSGSPN